MQAHSIVVAWIRDLVQANFVAHVVDVVFLVYRLFRYAWRRWLSQIDLAQVRKGVQSFLQLALENLHDTMGVGVVVDGRAFTG